MFDHVSVCGTGGEILVPALNQPRGRPYTEWGQRDARRRPLVSLSLMRASGFSALLRLPNRFVVQR